MVHLRRCGGAGIVLHLPGAGKTAFLQHTGAGRVVFQNSCVNGVMLRHQHGDELQQQFYGSRGIPLPAVVRAQPIDDFDVLPAGFVRGVFCPQTADNATAGADGVTAARIGGTVLDKCLSMVQLIGRGYQQIACNLLRGYQIVQRSGVRLLPRLEGESAVNYFTQAESVEEGVDERKLFALVLRYHAGAGKTAFFEHAPAGYIVHMGEGDKAPAVWGQGGEKRQKLQQGARGNASSMVIRPEPIAHHLLAWVTTGGIPQADAACGLTINPYAEMGQVLCYAAVDKILCVAKEVGGGQGKVLLHTGRIDEFRDAVGVILPEGM